MYSAWSRRWELKPCNITRNYSVHAFSSISAVRPLGKVDSNSSSALNRSKGTLKNLVFRMNQIDRLDFSYTAHCAVDSSRSNPSARRHCCIWAHFHNFIMPSLKQSLRYKSVMQRGSDVHTAAHGWQIFWNSLFHCGNFKAGMNAMRHLLPNLLCRYLYQHNRTLA